jgi:hypothetical protein
MRQVPTQKQEEIEMQVISVKDYTELQLEVNWFLSTNVYYKQEDTWFYVILGSRFIEMSPVMIRIQ